MQLQRLGRDQLKIKSEIQEQVDLKVESINRSNQEEVQTIKVKYEQGIAFVTDAS